MSFISPKSSTFLDFKNILPFTHHEVDNDSLEAELKLLAMLIQRHK